MKLSLSIDPDQEIPLYLRLVAAMREAIVSQHLMPGQKLPSAQELAESFSMSRATVVKAYNALISQGYLEAITGSGTFVSKRIDLPEVVEPVVSSLKKQELPGGLSQYAKRILDIKLVEPTLAGLPELNFGSPPVETLPREKWKEILIKYCRVKPPNLFDCANEIFGYRPLRSAIASFLMRTKGVTCSTDQVILFEGSHAFSHIVRLLIEPGDLVVVENPGYLGARDSLVAEGAKLIAGEVDGDGLMVEPLRRGAVKAKLCYITCPHHDPTGAIMPLERRLELLEWAKTNDTFIVEDGFDSDYHYGIQPPPALQGLDDSGRVLYIYSFWKTLSPLVSLGVLVIPAQLIAPFARAKFLTDRQFPTIEHYALTEIIADGHLDLHIKKTGKIYQARRQKLIYSLSQHFRNQIYIPRASGGLHTLVQFKLPRTNEEILRAAGQAGLPLVSSSYSYMTAPKQGEFLIPFATMEDDEIEPAVNRFAIRLIGYTGY